MFIVLALRCGASELKLVPLRDKYHLSVLIGDDRFRLSPPPLHWRLTLPQVFRAIAGLAPTSPAAEQSADLVAIVPQDCEREWSVRITCIPRQFGEITILEMPEWRDPDTEMLEELIVDDSRV